MTEIKGRTLAKFDDGIIFSGKNVVAGNAVGKKEGYATLQEALDASERNEGSEVITQNQNDGRYYVNQVSDSDFGSKSSSQSQIKEYKSRDFIKVVAFTDKRNNVVSRADNNENLSQIGNINTVVSRLNSIKGKVPEEKQLAFVALTLGIGTPATFSTMKKIEATLKKLPDHLSAELKEKFKELIKPENLKIMAGVMAAYGASHFIGVGEVADVVLAGVGIATLGADAKKVIDNFYGAYNSIKDAKTDQDLDSAAKKIADGLTTIAMDAPMVGGAYKGGKGIVSGVSEIRGVVKESGVVAAAKQAGTAGREYVAKIPSTVTKNVKGLPTAAQETIQNVRDLPKSLGIQKKYSPTPLQRANDIKREVLVPTEAASSETGVFRVKKGANYEYIRNPSAKRFPQDFSTEGGVIKSTNGGKNVSSRFMYVIDENNNMIVGNRNKLLVYTKNGERIVEGDKIPLSGKKLDQRKKELAAQGIVVKEISHPHPTLIGGANPKIKSAGIIEIQNGKIKSVDLESGHYRPKNNTSSAVEEALKKLDPKLFSPDYKGVTLRETQSYNTLPLGVSINIGSQDDNE